MLYLRQFKFPSENDEFNFLISVKRTCYDSFYPFQVLGPADLKDIRFKPVTIFYGGNGSGKTTVLNVIAEKLKIQRHTLYNRSNFWEDYLKDCDATSSEIMPDFSRVITSDDVFDYMLNIRALNEGIHQQRETIFAEYLDAKYSDFKFRTMADYEELKKVNETRRRTQSKYTRENLMDNVRGFSNGESGFKYFTDYIREPGLYLLDEPENSLSPERQIELVAYLEDSSRFFGCQFIIATHSPFILAMKDALIYDLDEVPAKVKDWTALKNVRVMYEFFEKHRLEFENKTIGDSQQNYGDSQRG